LDITDADVVAPDEYPHVPRSIRFQDPQRLETSKKQKKKQNVLKYFFNEEVIMANISHFTVLLYE
jgi:hypothetical protein